MLYNPNVVRVSVRLGDDAEKEMSVTLTLGANDTKVLLQMLISHTQTIDLLDCLKKLDDAGCDISEFLPYIKQGSYSNSLVKFLLRAKVSPEEITKKFAKQYLEWLLPMLRQYGIGIDEIASWLPYDYVEEEIETFLKYGIDVKLHHFSSNFIAEHLELLYDYGYRLQSGDVYRMNSEQVLNNIDLILEHDLAGSIKYPDCTEELRRVLAQRASEFLAHGATYKNLLCAGVQVENLLACGVSAQDIYDYLNGRYDYNVLLANLDVLARNGASIDIASIVEKLSHLQKVRYCDVLNRYGANIKFKEEAKKLYYDEVPLVEYALARHGYKAERRQKTTGLFHDETSEGVFSRARIKLIKKKRSL